MITEELNPILTLQKKIQSAGQFNKQNIIPASQENVENWYY